MTSGIGLDRFAGVPSAILVPKSSTTTRSARFITKSHVVLHQQHRHGRRHATGAATAPNCCFFPYAAGPAARLVKQARSIGSTHRARVRSRRCAAGRGEGRERPAGWVDLPCQGRTPARSGRAASASNLASSEAVEPETCWEERGRRRGRAECAPIATLFSQHAHLRPPVWTCWKVRAMPSFTDFLRRGVIDLLVEHGDGCRPTRVSTPVIRLKGRALAGARWGPISATILAGFDVEGDVC